MSCVQTKVLPRGQRPLVLTLLIAKHLDLILLWRPAEQLPQQKVQTTSLLLMQIFP
jgi:hypothetical protein